MSSGETCKQKSELNGNEQTCPGTQREDIDVAQQFDMAEDLQ